jgi:hypothetical protein
MQQTHDDSLTLLDLKRALEDEIYYLAVAENFAHRTLKMATREQILQEYYTKYPDLKKYVDDHVAREPCLLAIRELRRRREKRLQATEARRLSSPKPSRNPEMEWMAPFRAEPLTIAPLARPLPPPPLWGILSDELESALEAVPEEEPTGQTGVAPSAKDALIYQTGLPGRPSTWWLVDREVRRRFTLDDQAPMKTAEWARAMLEWLRREHPSAPPVREKTLRNKLAGLLRQLKATAKLA